MPNLRNILLSKQIKIVYNILESNYAHWNMIGKKNLLQKFDEQYNDRFFLCKCSNIKGLDISDLPGFYQGAINSWVVLQSKMKINDKTSIMNSNLFGNTHICIRNRPPLYQNFCESNIRSVRDIWNINTKTFYDDGHIYNILIGKSNWRQKYNKIKRNIPETWVNTLKEDTGIPEPTPANLSINQNLMIYSKSKYVEPDKLKLRILQSYFLDETYKPKYKIKWNTKFNKENHPQCYFNRAPTPVDEFF